MTRLAGGQHAGTWSVGTANPALTVVVRQFPVDDPAAAHEAQVLLALGGFGGLAPVLLDSDVAGQWSECPTTLISWLDGHADITPADPDSWAAQLGHTLALVHAVRGNQMSSFPSVVNRSSGSLGVLTGPLATWIRSEWSQIVARQEVLTHSDYWSGNVVWRDGALAGVVDWSGAARGPRGYDVGWCRLDLYLLFDERVADVFLTAYEDATGHQLTDVALWDGWAAARSHDIVETWAANYGPLGRADLDEAELRQRHCEWTSRLREKTQD